MLVVVTAAAVVLVLHYRSRDPHTAGRQPHVAGSRQVNPAIERRAQRFLVALRAGDEGTLRGMALTSFDRDSVNAFVTAFGRRNDQLASLQTSDLGERRGVLDIAVPCKDQPAQHATVLFGWKRTSFINSGWYAIINPPGPQYAMPNGCIAP
ncbi:MAG: hypothetical protein ACJ74U_10825 [Jatrophihabitantaceae bacterium]